MSRVDEAAQVIAEALRPALGAMSDGVGMDISQALAAEGLLAPELPGPEEDNGNTFWSFRNLDVFYEDGGDSICVQDDEGMGWIVPTEDSRQLAHMILAACDHAEKEV